MLIDTEVDREVRMRERLRQIGLNPIEYSVFKMRVLTSLVADEDDAGKRREILNAARSAFEEAVFKYADMFQWKRRHWKLRAGRRSRSAPPR